MPNPYLHPSTPPLRRILYHLLTPPHITHPTSTPTLLRLLRPILRPFLPKRYFIGQDLYLNTYWELPNRLSPSRPRRIVQLNSKPPPDPFPSEVGTTEKEIWKGPKSGDYTVPSPQWHQWLRCVRLNPPTIQELIDDERRKVLLKLRAATIEERERKRKEEIAKEAERLLLKQERKGGEEGMETGRKTMGLGKGSEGLLREIEERGGPVGDRDEEVVKKVAKEDRERQKAQESAEKTSAPPQQPPLTDPWEKARLEQHNEPEPWVPGRPLPRR